MVSFVDTQADKTDMEHASGIVRDTTHDIAEPDDMVHYMDCSGIDIGNQVERECQRVRDLSMGLSRLTTEIV